MNKKIIIGIIISGIIFGSVGVYAGSNMYANNISVNAPTGSNLGSDATLQNSLDELYSIADKYDELNKKISSLETTMLDKIYPVGSIYITTDITSASDVAKKFGGTWEVYGTGKTLVGVDKNDTNFNTIDKTGGNSTTTLTTSNLPSHTHSISHTHTTPATNTGIESSYHTHNLSHLVSPISGTPWFLPNYGNSSMLSNQLYWQGAQATDYESQNHVHTLPAMTTNSQSTTTSGSTGSGTSFSNLQPYITVYMYKRTK